MIEVEFSLSVEFQRCKVFRHWFLTFPLVSSPEILDAWSFKGVKYSATGFDVSPGQFSGNSGLRSVKPVISAITAAALAEAVVLDEASALD